MPSPQGLPAAFVLPTSEELERALASDLAWTESELRSKIVEVAPVSPLRGRGRPRTAFRLRLADGRQLKLRRMRSPERAAELARLVERLRDLGIPQVVGLRAETLLVDWVEGTPFDASADRSERREEAARLLGRIHATADLDGLALPCLQPTAGELLAMAEELAFLVRAQRLEVDTAERLSEAARARDPGRALHGIVHGDFCAENFVIDRDDRLRVVDNEGIELGPLARDLARVWTRWPMPASAWQRFLAAYRSASGAHADGPELALWKIRSLVRSAWYRVGYRLAGDDVPLARLRSLLEGL